MFRRKKEKTRLKVFLGFLIFGVALGLTQNLLVVKLATDHPLDLKALTVSLVVLLPFAAISELIVDRTNLLPRYKKKKNKNRLMKNLEVFLEFLIFGIFIAMIDDLIIITILTGEMITLEVIATVFLVVIPFAIIGELIVDRKDWFPGLVKTKSIREP